jgi:hypothetical protein
MFPHRNIHKFTWTSLDGKMHNQTDHILIYRRWHSSTLAVRSFRAADCDTDHYLVVAKVRERLALSKDANQEKMEARIDANNKKFEVLQGTLISRKISTKRRQCPSKKSYETIKHKVEDVLSFLPKDAGPPQGNDRED